MLVGLYRSSSLPAVLALLLLIFGSHVPECASEAGAVDGVVGRKTALLGPLLVIVSYFQLQAAMHGILDDNVSEMVSAADDQLCALTHLHPHLPLRRTTRASPSASAKLGSGNGREYWYFVYVFCRATGVDPALCGADFRRIVDPRLRERHRERRRRQRRGGRGGELYVSLYLVVILAALISSILLTAAAVSAAATLGGDRGSSSPRRLRATPRMYEALNDAHLRPRPLVVLQLLGYAAFHAHVLCAPLQVLFWVAFLLHIALLLISTLSSALRREG